MESSKKSFEMKIVYIILALLLLIWAILFLGQLREVMLNIIKEVFT